MGERGEERATTNNWAHTGWYCVSCDRQGFMEVVTGTILAGVHSVWAMDNENIVYQISDINIQPRHHKGT